MAYGNTESRRRKQEVFTVKHYGVFDMIGPVMVGPSSSHTAGAARLGLDVYKRQIHRRMTRRRKIILW